MPKVVLDTTILVSAFLSKAGVSRQLLHEAQAGAFQICLAEEILAETKRVLLEYPRIRKRYDYPDEAVIEYVNLLQVLSQMVTSLPKIKVVTRDPNDDMVIACALKAKAQYIVSRDKDLLELEDYQQIIIISPEAFMQILRETP
jgi:putative PIN family toxin of toxin-antitoxin system